MGIFFCFLALVLAVAEVKSDHMDDMHKFDMACREESKVSADDIKAFFQSASKDEPKEALKCHIKCLMEKKGHWINNAFDAAAAKKQLQDTPNLKDRYNEMSKIIDECSNNNDSNKKEAKACNIAYSIAKCMIDKQLSSM